ncbi:xanthine dehydrogenase family protein subunit M [Lacrimispora sp. 210928-DFI.3.58]|nr:xanthine dehydrogenase family protein subunit M [Lacrimispora sp. 210928-DFI.3.58]
MMQNHWDSEESAGAGRQVQIRRPSCSVVRKGEKKMSLMYQPNQVEEAVRLLAGEKRKACAGATNLYVDRHHGAFLDYDYVSLDRIEELRGIRRTENGWEIGSMTTFAEIERSEIPFGESLSQSASVMGSPQIRNRGTIGGNILCASPASDGVVPLMALEARLELISVEEKRTVPLEGFLLGVGRTGLRPGELLTKIILPEKSGQSVFYKAGKRNAAAISVCGQAVYLNLLDNRIRETAIAMGSVAPTVVRAHRAEELLLGASFQEMEDPAFCNGLKHALMEDIFPIDDIRATAEYRRRIAFRMLLHNLKELQRRFK